MFAAAWNEAGEERPCARRELHTSCADFSEGRVTSAAPQACQIHADATAPLAAATVPETLVAPLEELERAYAEARARQSFQKELDDLFHNFAGRPTAGCNCIRVLLRAARRPSHLSEA